MLYQTVVYSRAEVFPKLNLWQSIVACIGAQVLAYCVFWWLMSAIRDPFYFHMFATTVLLSSLFNIPMMRARGSRKGFALAPLIGVALIPISTWGWVYMSDPYFHQPFIVVTAILNVLLALLGIWYYLQLPEYHPERQASAA